MPQLLTGIDRIPQLPRRCLTFPGTGQPALPLSPPSLDAVGAGQLEAKASRRVIAVVSWLAQGHFAAGRSRRRRPGASGGEQPQPQLFGLQGAAGPSRVSIAVQAAFRMAVLPCGCQAL